VFQSDERLAVARAEAAAAEEAERRQILDALRRSDGNRTAAATTLGISLRRLYYRLNEYERQGVAVPAGEPVG
jgi:DNA-binding NtrC family response regulator